MALPSDDIDATIQGTILAFDGSGFDATRVVVPTVTWANGNYVMLYAGLPFGNNMQIGLATSADGVAWTRYSDDPVIANSESQSWGSFREMPISVIYEDGGYKLWFAGDNSNLATDSGYGFGFGLATSTDAVDWTWDTENPIRWEPYAPSGNGINLVEVVKLDGQYHAYFVDQNPTGDILEHAVSSDGVSFTGDTPLAVPAGYQLQAATTAFDDATQYVFAVFRKDGQQFYGTSLDGQNFTIQGTIDLPPEFATQEILIANGKVTFFGSVAVGNVNWGFGNEVIQMATADLGLVAPPNEIVATVENGAAQGTDADDAIFGLGGNERLFGLAGDDILVGGPGNDQLDGGAGVDVAIFIGNYDNFRLQGDGARLQVQDTTRLSGNDRLIDVELLQFDDGYYDTRNETFTAGAFATPQVETLVTNGLPTG